MAVAISSERKRSSGAESFLEMSGNVDNVFGMGDSGLPMWFKPERFLEPDFSPEAYVADLRRSIPLETLAHELKAHLSTLKAKLVEVINEDYNDFISLSTKLVNVDGVVMRMQKPLLEVKERLTAVQAAVGAELEALGAGLQRRQQIASARALLELMQDAAHVMSKVEKLLAEVDAAEAEALSPRAGPASALDARTRMFERLASEISRLSFYIARGKELPFIQQLEGRMAEASGRLQALLSGGLRDALKTGNVSARTYCLQAYAAVGDTAGAEEVVREAVVKPLVDRVLAEQRQRQPRAGPAAEPLAPVLEAVATGVRTELGALLQAVLAPQSGLHAFNFLANSLLAHLDAVLADALPGAFSPGLPASFLANYKAAVRFLDELESYCQLASDVAAFRAAAPYDTFLRRWKLSVYFSLRFQEIAGALETVVSSPSLTFVTPEARPSGAEPRLELAASHALHHCLIKCTSSDVFLPGLADKFVKLALQLLARYREWLHAGFRARYEAAATALQEAGVGTTGSTPGAQSPAGSGTLGEEGAAAPQQHWALACNIEQLTAIRADVDALADWVRQDYVILVCRLLGSAGPQVTVAVGEALSQAAGDVAAQGGPAINAIVGDLAERCAHVCKQMNGITAMYRMATRPPPSRPSHYVSGILVTLRNFLDGDAAKLLQPPALAQLSAGVVDAVAERYSAMAVKMLDTLRKTESSLKRLKKNRVAEAAADGSQLSDIDKISLQLFLDVEEFGRQAAKFGTTPAQLPGYQELWRVVAPADKQGAIRAT